MRNVTIHNCDGSELGVTTFQHAIDMLVRGVAEEYRWADGFYGAYRKVTAVILKASKYVFPKWLYSTAPAAFCKMFVRWRDDYVCAYCGRYGDEVEHVVPKHQGGRLCWENTVTACRPCNSRKRNRTPEQAGMRLRYQPRVPTVAEMNAKKQKYGRRRHRVAA